MTSTYSKNLLTKVSQVSIYNLFFLFQVILYNISIIARPYSEIFYEINGSKKSHITLVLDP